MRRDMSKVLVLRGRGGSGWKRKGRPPKDGTLPKREAMGPGRGTKWLGENLAPLARFLQRRVGMQWNEVHSEMCQHVRLNNAVQRHALEHVEAFVALHPFFVGGTPHAVKRQRGKNVLEPMHRSRRHRFYVSEAGTLLECEPSPRRRRKARRR